MAKPLRSQLNQIRAWVQQGRTDAWIAHQLEVSTSELREFRRRHELNADEESTGEVDLRDEIEAEIEAAMDADEEEAEEEEVDDEEEDEPVDLEDSGDAEPSGADDDSDDAEPASDDAEPAAEGDEAPKRRRRRRGGRGRGRKALQATFDHGDKDGYGLWLDPAVKDDPVYAEHWAGHREVEVSVQPEQIVIKRS
jgi:hypothetical protein